MSTIAPSVGDCLLAPDANGYICKCKVLEIRGTDAKVHFCNFNKRHDQWVPFRLLRDPAVNEPHSTPSPSNYLVAHERAKFPAVKAATTKGATCIIHWNCNGLLNGSHLADVKRILLDKPTLLCLSETKLDESCDGEENIPGYTAYRADRNHKLSVKSKGAGGGVLVYAPSDLDAAWTAKAGPDFEMGILDFNSKCGGMRIVSLYRRPGNTVSECLLDELTAASATGKTIVLTGDININTLLCDPPPTSLHNHLRAVIGTQLVRDVTRPASNACLDHFWVSNSVETSSLHATVMDDSGSDHLPIRLTINRPIEKQKPKPRKRPNWKAVPKETIQDFIQQYDWRKLFLCTTLVLAMAEWIAFVEQLTSLPPLTGSRPRSIAITPALLSMMKERDAARKTDGPRSKNYKILRNKVVALSRTEKRREAEHAIAKAGTDASLKWKALNNLLGRKANEVSPPPLDANATNTFYVRTLERLHTSRIEARTKLGNCLPHDNEWHPRPVLGGSRMDLQSIPEHKTRSLLRAIQGKSASGPDLMPAFIYKKFAFELAKPLTKIFNLSVAEQTFPQEWKSAEVIPIYKNKGPKDVPDSYRPVSILAIAGKILEKAIQLQLKNHLYTNRIIPDHQHGFRPNHSTSTCTLSIADAISHNIDNGEVTALVALDYSKAFDTISHGKLVTILRTDAMLSDNAANWIESYLSQRTQSVRIGAELSSPQAVSSGVPQGSVLGPILFTVYTARMPSPEFGHLFMFADDTTLVIPGKDASEVATRTNKALAEIETFSYAMDLFLNIGKTQLVLCSSPQKRRHIDDIQINTSSGRIPESAEAKILGLLFDRHLSWAPHLQAQARKAAGRCRAIARTSWMLNRTTLSMLFHTLVFSLTDYCDVTWADASQSAVGSIDRITNLAARITCHAPHRTATAPLLATLGWIDAPSRRLEHRRNFLKSVSTTGLPSNLAEQLTITRPHDRSTRATSRGITSLPHFRTNYGRRTVKYWSSTIHNSRC